MTKSFVYWLYNSTCGLIEETGYVGITKDPVNRKKEHLISKRVPSDSVMSILFEGTREECENKELELRPDFNIGWNLAKGGRRGRVGGTHSDDTRGKISKANKGVPKSKQHCKNISRANKGRVISKETREKISEANKGKVISKQHRENIGKANKGVPKSKQHCKNISKANKGKVISKQHREKLSKANKGHIVSQETREKISAAKKGIPKSKETRAKMKESWIHRKCRSELPK